MNLKHHPQPARKRALNPRRLRICMVAYSFYEQDNRIMRYARALLDQGHRVDVLALRRHPLSSFEELEGARVYRIQDRVVNERTRFDYLWRISRFILHSAGVLTRKHLKTPYDVIHIHSVPDFIVFAGILPKLLGARMILDIHDIMPEFYVSKFDGSVDGVTFKLLSMLEKVCASLADHVIISNHLWYRALRERSVPEEKLTVMMNYPEEIFFSKQRPPKKDEKFIFLYPGSLNRHQGVDLGVRAIERIQQEAPEVEFHIYGDGPAKPELQALVQKLGLDSRVFLHDPVSLRQVPDLMARADAGLIPKRNDGFGGEAFSTKAFEFMGLGVPVVLSRTKIDRYYFKDSLVKFFEPGDEASLANAMLEMVRNHRLRESLSINAGEYVRRFRWKTHQHAYLNIIDALTSDRMNRPEDLNERRSTPGHASPVN